MTDFHPSAPRPVPGYLLLCLPFLASGPDMRDVVMLSGFLATLVIIVALICTQMLRGCVGRLRSHHHYRLQGISQEFHVMAIGSSDHHRKGNALALGQQTALRPFLATVRGMGARGLPPKGALVIAPSTLCQVHSSPLRSS